MKKSFIIPLIIIVLLVSNVSALTLKITPSSLTFNGEPDKELCSKLTIESTTPDVKVSDSFEGSIVLSYDESMTVVGSKDAEVCVTAPSKGLYQGYMIFRTIKPGGSIGVELKVKTTVDTRIPDFKKDQIKEISSFQTKLEITTNEDVIGSVTISKHDEIANPGKILLGDLIEINADEEIKNNLKSVTIKKYYTNEELFEKNLDEDSLKLYYYNGNWEELNSNINKNAKYVYVTLNHFSIYGIFGDENENPDSDGDGITDDADDDDDNDDDDRRSSSSKRSSSSNKGSDEITSFMATVAADSPDCTENWKCGSWSECVKNKQTRTCKDTNKCGTAANKPIESRACTAETTPLTGHAIATPKSSSPDVLIGISLVLLIVIFGILAYALIVYIRK